MALKRVCRELTACSSQRSLMLATACHALTPALGRDVGIRRVIRVPRRAVRLACIDRRRRDAAQVVDPLTDDLQVGGIHAARVAAEMIEMHACGDRAAQQFPCDSVRAQHAPCRRLGLDDAVTERHSRAAPRPALARLIRRDVAPETIRESERSWSRWH